MEAVGTVVGITALGITLCDGVVAYCRAWKHQDDDVESLSALCTVLNDLLQEIERRVQGCQTLDPNIVGKLNDPLQACSRQCDAALRLTEKYAGSAGPATTPWKGKARDLAQRLKFPFEKKTLEELKMIMIAFRGNVDIALALLKLDISISTQEIVQTLQTDNSKDHQALLEKLQSVGGQVSQSIGTELGQKFPLLKDNLSRKIDTSQRSIEATIAQSSTALSNSVVAQMDQRLPMLEESLCNAVAQRIDTSRSSIDAGITNLSADIKSTLNANSMQQMMVLTSILNEVSQNEGQFFSRTHFLKSPLSNSSLLRSKKNRRQQHKNLVKSQSSACICGPNIGRFNVSSSSAWGFNKQSEACDLHKRSCPLWHQSRMITQYGINLLFFRRHKIFWSISIGGNPYSSIFERSISQNLTYKAVVADDAPAFKVLRRYLEIHDLEIPEFEVDEHNIKTCLQDLKIVFQSGYGSPRDTLDDGTTLIEFAFLTRGVGYSYSTHALWQLCRELLSLGVEMNLNGDSRGDRIFPNNIWIQFAFPIFSDYSTQFPYGQLGQLGTRTVNILEFLMWLVKHDIDIPPTSGLNFAPDATFEMKPWHGFRRILSILQSSEDSRIATGCGVVSTAVLYRDETAVRKALKQCPRWLKTERNLFGHSAIDLAIGWPVGLQLLLGAADESLLCQELNDRESTALDYAIAFGCAESIQILADAGIPFTFEWNCFVGTDCLSLQVSQAVLEIVSETLRQLFDFGKQKLSAEKIASLQITQFDSFDSKARLLLDCLWEEDIQIPSKFDKMHCWLRYGSFFHHPDIHPGTARALFQAGFTDVDSESDQVTPLLNLSSPNRGYNNEFYFSRFFGMVEFFVEKGVRLDRPIPSAFISNPLPRADTMNCHRVIHRIASSALNITGHFKVDMIAIMAPSRIWHSILQSDSSDPCICACASGGCRPISLALKVTWHRDVNLSSNRDDVWNPRRWRRTVELLAKLALLLDGIEGEQLAEDVIRFLTFSVLGLSHTCCHHHTDGSPVSHIFEEHFIKVMDPTDIEEIRDEEADLILRLDCLVDGFMKDFRDLELPISKFLVERWQETMLAERTVRDELSESSRAKLQELDVRLYVDTDLDADDCYWNDERRKKCWEEFRKEQEKTLKKKYEEDCDAYDEWMSGIREGMRR